MSESSIIKGIRGKVELLIAKNRELNSTSNRLLEQRDSLRLQNRELMDKVAELEKRVGVLELKDGMGGESDNTKQARARVNRLIKEVDKCIALLG